MATYIMTEEKVSRFHEDLMERNSYQKEVTVSQEEKNLVRLDPVKLLKVKRNQLA